MYYNLSVSLSVTYCYPFFCDVLQVSINSAFRAQELEYVLKKVSDVTIAYELVEGVCSANFYRKTFFNFVGEDFRRA